MRLRRVQEELGDALELEWRSFLLRPEPDPRRTLAAFRAHTRSWERAAADPDGGTFRVWATEAGPPSHSIPPHLVAKAAARLGPAAFAVVHARLFEAYFGENRDITDPTTLAAIWGEVGLEPAALLAVADPAILHQTIAEHNAAIELGVTGVPAVRAADNPVAVVGAQPLETYRRWARRLLDA